MVTQYTVFVTTPVSTHGAGVILISLALCADAVIGNVQEKALKQFSASNLEMVLFSYFIGFWYILLAVLVSGSLGAAFAYCVQVQPNSHSYLHFE